METTIYCEHCRKEQPYQIKKRLTFFPIGGAFPEQGVLLKDAYCTNCHKLGYSADLNDKNVEALDELNQKIISFRPKLKIIEVQLKKIDMSHAEFWDNLSLVGISSSDLLNYHDDDYISSYVANTIGIYSWEKPNLFDEETYLNNPNLLKLEEFARDLAFLEDIKED